MQPVDPQKTKRAAAFSLWMNAPMPMLTLFKTLDVSNLVRQSRRRKLPFHMLMCWCIGKAASQMEEFYLLPVGQELMRYDSIAVSTVVPTRDGGINTCDLAYDPDLERFAQAYALRTRQVQETGQALDLSESHMVIGASALARYEIDGAVNIYAGMYNNPYLIWGKYRKGLWKTTLSLSFQFHHTQMDGMQGGEFLERLQREIRQLRA